MLQIVTLLIAAAAGLLIAALVNRSRGRALFPRQRPVVFVVLVASAAVCVVVGTVLLKTA